MKVKMDVKLPKLFGRKEKVEETTKTEEVILERNEIPIAYLVGVPLVVGLTFGYLVGHHSGVKVNKNSIYVIK